jgi:hypothetical protein
MEFATGPTEAVFQRFLDAIDRGAVRLVASGPAGFEGWNGTIIVQIDDGDATLEDAVARVTAASMETANREMRDVDLEIGRAIRISSMFALTPDAPEGSVPSHTIEYVVRLEDGRTLWLMATGPQAAAGFDALIDPAVATLRRR